MSCVYEGCRQSESLVTRHWRVGKLCAKHHRELCDRYGSPNPAIPADKDPLVDDFVKVHVLLAFNTQKCLEYVGKLNEQMSKAKAVAKATDPRFTKDGHASPAYIKLSRALEYYEGYCWFPANRSMLTGLLDANGFFEALRLGFNKDPGAGSKHGEQSHRLQWHAIMRAVTNDFDKPIARDGGWNHSPLQLFYEFTQGRGNTAGPLKTDLNSGQQSPTGAWNMALDSQGNKGWGNPDRVVVDLLQSRFELVKQAVARRVDKLGGPDLSTPNPVAAVGVMDERRKALKDSTSELLVSRRIQLPINQHGLPQNTSAYCEDVANEIYRWEKTKTAPPRSDAGASSLHQAALKVLEDAKRKKPHLFEKARTPSYGTTPHHNLLVKKDAPEQILEIDADIVKKSLDRFCPLYQYSAVLGAHPIPSGPW